MFDIDFTRRKSEIQGLLHTNRMVELLSSLDTQQGSTLMSIFNE